MSPLTNLIILIILLINPAFIHTLFSFRRFLFLFFGFGADAFLTDN